MLFVSVYGPKGPSDEVTMKHVGHFNYQVSYLVKQRAEYVITVKWGEDHIPGSPFKVEIGLFSLISFQTPKKTICCTVSPIFNSISKNVKKTFSFKSFFEDLKCEFSNPLF